MSKVLAIVVTYNAEGWLSTCLPSVVALGSAVDLCVVDNASKDATPELLAGKYREHIQYYHPLAVNLGFGKAHNLVFAQPYASKYDYYFLLNQDASIPRKDFAILLRTAAEAPKFGILSPIHYSDREKVDLRFATYLSQTQHRKKIIEVDFVNAAIWLLRRSLVDCIGGFNPIFPHYGEDVNYALRTRLAGYRIGVLTATQGYHYRKQSPIPSRFERLPYHQWLTELNRLVDPGVPVWRAMAAVMTDYAPLLFYLLLRGRVAQLKAHLTYVGKLIMAAPTIARYRQLRIAVVPADPSAPG